MISFVFVSCFILNSDVFKHIKYNQICRTALNKSPLSWRYKFQIWYCSRIYLRSHTYIKFELKVTAFTCDIEWLTQHSLILFFPNVSKFICFFLTGITYSILQFFRRWELCIWDLLSQGVINLLITQSLFLYSTDVYVSGIFWSYLVNNSDGSYMSRLLEILDHKKCKTIALTMRVFSFTRL